jgi:LysM repeat protein
MPNIKAILGLLGVLALAGLGALMAWTQVPRGPAGDSLSWVTLEQKEKVAQALNATVKLKDFKAEVHVIGPKQNFWIIARLYKVNIDTILGLNPDFEGLEAKLKQALLIANQRGSLHQVREGETLQSVAALYEIKPQDIKAANRLGLFGLKPGALLFVPGAKPRQVSDKLAAVIKKRSFLRSPLAGRYTSQMGTRQDPFTGAVTHHNGVDIKANYNELVGASAAGTVVYAGWNGGFGKCVKIDHHNGYVTLYGHLNAILVRLGQEVKQHQIIGKVGATGRATGPHLHFTIYYQGKAKNPLDFLW